MMKTGSLASEITAPPIGVHMPSTPASDRTMTPSNRCSYDEAVLEVLGWLDQMAADLDRGLCTECQARIETLVQVDSSVWSLPCMHRLGQGTVDQFQSGDRYRIEIGYGTKRRA